MPDSAEESQKHHLSKSRPHGLALGQIQAHKFHPDYARARATRARSASSFTINPSGRVASAAIVRSTGSQNSTTRRAKSSTRSCLRGRRTASSPQARRSDSSSCEARFYDCRTPDRTNTLSDLGAPGPARGPWGQSLTMMGASSETTGFPFERKHWCRCQTSRDERVTQPPLRLWPIRGSSW